MNYLMNDFGKKLDFGILKWYNTYMHTFSLQDY